MAKVSPAASEGRVRLRRDDAFRDWTKKLGHLTDSDEQYRQQWLVKKTRFYNRRFGRFGKSGSQSRSTVTFPWIGAANHNIPLSEIAIDEIAGPLQNIVVGGRRIVQMVPMDPEAKQNAVNGNLAMEDLLRFRMGEYGCPDYARQTAFSVASFLQHGLAYDKAYYGYAVQPVTHRYDKDSAPDALRRIQVVPDGDIDEPTRAALVQQAGILVIGKGEFSQFSRQIEELAVRTFSLDLSESEDREALSDIMAWMKSSRQNDLEFSVTDVVEDGPRIVNVPITDIIVPPGTKRVETASRVTHDMFFSEASFLERALSSGWNADAIDLVLTHGKKGRRSARFSENDDLWQALRSRTSTTKTDTDSDEQQIKISQTYVARVTGKRLPERSVITWERDSGAILDASVYEYAHRTWPIIDTWYEYEENDLFSSRGLPEKLEDVEKVTTALSRHELNALSIEATPTFTYRMGSGFQPTKHRWAPGIFIPRNRPDDVMPLNFGIKSLAVERPMFQMMSLADRIAGTRQNSAVRDARLFEPPTAGDVQERATQFQSALGQRAGYFQDGRERIYRQVWALWTQYGPQDFYVHITGEGMEKLSQNDIRGRFRTVPVGAVGNSNPDVMLQRELAMLDIMVKSTPYISQDVRFVMDIPQKVKDILDLMDPYGSGRVMKVRSPEEQQRLLEMQQAEAERLAAMKEQAHALQEGAPVDPARQGRLLAEIKKVSPHAGLQQVIAGADQAMATANQNASLASNGQIA
jgi:hypothetical protein